jgi:hypothetical protein
MLTNELTRVLLITPPDGSESVAASPQLPDATAWASVAETLRAEGFAAEICGGASPYHRLDSIRISIEHSWPDVVVASADAAGPDAARDVLRAARQIVPTVITVLSGTSADPMAGRQQRDRAVDHVVRGSDDEALVALLTRLRAARRPHRALA